MDTKQKIAEKLYEIKDKLNDLEYLTLMNLLSSLKLRDQEDINLISRMEALLEKRMYKIISLRNKIMESEALMVTCKCEINGVHIFYDYIE
jgi:hypothetical protein